MEKETDIKARFEEEFVKHLVEHVGNVHQLTLKSTLDKLEMRSEDVLFSGEMEVGDEDEERPNRYFLKYKGEIIAEFSDPNLTIIGEELTLKFNFR